MNQPNDERPMHLVIDGNDVSRYVTFPIDCQENTAEWTVHTEFIPNEHTADVLRPLNGRKVRVEYELKPEEKFWPRCSGYGEVAWRVRETGNEELILHGIGRLSKAKPAVEVDPGPIQVPATRFVTQGGKVVHSDGETEVTISFPKEAPQQRAIREAQLQLAQDAEIKAVTSPGFVLFLANSAISSYRSLYNTGMAHDRGELLYPSFIFLPLAIEYFMKYLLFTSTGSLKKEYGVHRLLVLFDFLPFEIQAAIDNEFKNELEEIGKERTSEALRVFLKKSQNAFTAIRYLFDARNATTSRHLLRPDNIVVLTCVANAIERVSNRM